jgi:hypothetical protein
MKGERRKREEKRVASAAVSAAALCVGEERVSPSLFFFFLSFFVWLSVGFSSEMWSSPSLSCLNTQNRHELSLCKKKKKNSSKLDISIEFQSNMFQRLNNVV